MQLFSVDATIFLKEFQGFFCPQKVEKTNLNRGAARRDGVRYIVYKSSPKHLQCVYCAGQLSSPVKIINTLKNMNQLLNFNLHFVLIFCFKKSF